MAKVFLFIWFVFFSAICIAGPLEDSAIQAAFPGKVVNESSVGDIGGSKHLFALVSDEFAREIAIAVFGLNGAGEYQLQAASKWWPRHPRWQETSVEVRNGSMYFSLRGSGGCCADYFSQYQFRPKGGVFTLVGVESHDIGFEPKRDRDGTAIEDEYISYKYGSSVNYLNGKVKHFRVQAPSSSDRFKDDILRVRSGKKRIERTFDFVLGEEILLSGFDLFAEPVEQPKHLRGYFDQSFNYSE